MYFNPTCEAYDFNKLRKEHNPLTIDEFETFNEDICSSDQQWWNKKWKSHYLETFQKKLTSSDDVVAFDQMSFNRQTWKHYFPNYKNASQAITRRYIRTTHSCVDGVKRSQFIVLDYDKDSWTQ